MVAYIKSDLEFILEQIKVAEKHAAYIANPLDPNAAPLYGTGAAGQVGSVPAYTLSFGLRQVDGRNNNLLPGQEEWGAADLPFPELLTPAYRPAPGPATIDMDGPGGMPALPVSQNYNPSNDPNSIIIDPALRTISNLIVDQTLANPAAIMAALKIAGTPGDHLAIAVAIKALFTPIEGLFLALDAATVASTAATAAAEVDPANTELAAAAAAAAQAVTDAQATLDGARGALDVALVANGIETDGNNVSILNVSPDVGLSAPFNSWFTLFGQFFDHGLDLVNKGGSGTVFIPLQQDDPLYDPNSNTNFMVLTRATVSAGTDGVMGTADDVRPVNTTTPFVDQNQTYTSHSSHQVFLRQFEIGADGHPHATGKLIEGGGAQAGGMATWGEVKAQAATILGIKLTDFDVGNVPLLRTDEYGNFIADANGMPQLILGIGTDGIPNTADDIVVSGNLLNPVDPTTATTTVGATTYTGALRIDHAFLADIAHNAVPTGKIADGDITIGLGNPGNSNTEYDNELLDAHFIAGDGRVNENIGLTAVHSIFHSEHNRLVEHTKEIVLASNDLAFLNEWLATDLLALPNPAQIADLNWDGERLFQAAKFGTEMQYQHLVFEDFARKIQPNIDFFVVPDGYHADINPAIVAEFAHVVYRFGHSMLTEQIDRLDPSFNADQIGLIEGFLNPIEFDSNHTIADGIAAGDIIRGMTRQVGNEIDEFVTTALRNNLLGLPLDLATINLARGRDAGVPSLNAARRDFYEASNHASELKPYESWVDFAGNLKNEASVINFIAAYGTHALITGQTTVEGKRDAALTLVTGVAVGAIVIADPVAFEADRLAFLNATGAYATSALGGLENIDLWIGGLAEKIPPFGGMLGSTFNFVFEVQMEQLQDGDRFYYLQRLDGLHLLSEMENNTFAKLILMNADAGHLPSDVFSTPGLILEVDRTKQWNPDLGETDPLGNGLDDDPLTTGVDESADNLGNDPLGGSILTPLVIRNNPATAGADTNYLRYTGVEHVLLGGTDQADILIASEGDDTLYGDGGNDRMEGGAGNDQYIGGDGDDIITDSFGDDIMRTGRGHDAVNAGQGVDLIVADEGQDFIVLGADMLDEAFGGVGNDFVLGSKTTEQTLGGEGDDWIEVGAWTGAVGDNFDDQFVLDAVKGHDVFHGDGGFDEFVGEGGDDIWFGSLGRGKFDGMSGYDWTTYANMQLGQTVDLTLQQLPGTAVNTAIDTFTNVEGISGSAHNDVFLGTDVTADLVPTEGFRGSALDAEGIALIQGLQAVLAGAGPASFDAQGNFVGGNIMLGGDGSDTMMGRGGDDILDGDKWLRVRIAVMSGYDENGPTGTPTGEYHDSMTTLVSKIFSGEINPGQLKIVRDIVSAGDLIADTDVAVFSDIQANYGITSNTDGSIRVEHLVPDGAGGFTPGGIDGIDTLRSIEVLRFSDGDLVLGKPELDLHGDVTVTNTATVAEAYRDQFDSASHSRSDGDVAWGATPWAESGDTTTGNVITGGQIQIDGTSNNVLRFGTGDGATITRPLNLAGRTTATLTFTYDMNDLEANKNLVVEARNASTSAWEPLGSLLGSNTGGGNSNNGTFTAVLTPAQIGATSAIRITAVGIWGEANDSVTVDNLNVATTTVTTTTTPGAPGINYVTTFTEGGNAVAITAGPTITDNNSTQMGSARIVLTNAQLDDVLLVGALPAGITASTDLSVSGQIIVNLTGASSLANYQAAIRAVSFDNVADEPTAGDRIIQVTVNDGLLDSDVATSTVTVVNINDAPTANQDNIITNTAANNSFVVPEWVMLANDEDPEGNVLDVTAATENDGNTFAVAFNAGSVTATSTNTNDHDFQYTLSDGAATDTGNVEIDYVTGTALTGNGNANILIGNNAVTTINGAGGDDIILAGGGNDTITQTGSTGGRDFVDGGADVDTYQLNGATGAETFVVYSRPAAEDALLGIVLNAATEIVITRNGQVIAELDNIEEIRVNTQQVTSPGGTPPGGSTANTGDTIQVVGNFTGTSLNFNTITIDGNAGDDTIDITSLNSAHRIVFKSNGGNDTIIGNLRPQDVIELANGEALTDYVETTADGVTTLTNGDHSISYVAAGAGPQVGGETDDEEDDDTAGNDDGDDGACDDDETSSTAAGTVRTGTPQADVLIGTADDDNIIAFAGDDFATGNAGADTISAGDGADFLSGGSGRDVIFAGAGDDQVFGGDQADVIYGDAGADRIFGDGGNDLINAGAGDDAVFGGSGNDLIMAEAGDGNDVYFGDDSDGGTGSDTLDMSAISAAISVNLGSGSLMNGIVSSSQSGNDTIWGIENVNTGSGNDTITASNAVNVMNGGAGNDTFKFVSASSANGDSILGFEPGDRLDLTGIDAKIGEANDQAFELITGAAFTAAGQLAVTFESRTDGDYTIVQGNIDGTNDADFKIEIAGHHNLTNTNVGL